MKSSPDTPPIVSVLAGGFAGGVEGFISYPIEFAKTRVQLRQEKGVKPPRNPFAVVSQVIKVEGYRALYKGCGALVIGSVGKDAVRFLSYDTIKNAFKDPETGTLSPTGSMLAGMTAGVAASILAVTPTERVKTALIDDARHAKSYASATDCVRSILRTDGFIGLYRGFAGTTLKQAGATSFRMGSYNIMKDYQERNGIEQNAAVTFANGAVAGTVTTLATQPFDCIKTRSQAKEVTTTVQAVRSIWEDGGIRGFWRGTIMRLGRTVMSGGILFTTAEAATKVLNPMFIGNKPLMAI